LYHDYQFFFSVPGYSGRPKINNGSPVRERERERKKEKKKERKKERKKKKKKKQH